MSYVFRPPWDRRAQRRRLWQGLPPTPPLELIAGNAGRFSTGGVISSTAYAKAGNAGRISTGADAILYANLHAGNAARFSTGADYVSLILILGGNAARFSTGANPDFAGDYNAGNAARFSTGAILTLVDCCDINAAAILLLRSDIAAIMRKLKEMSEDHAYIIRLLRILDADVRRDHNVQNATRERINQIADRVRVGRSMGSAVLGEHEYRNRDSGIRIPRGPSL